MIGSRSFHLTYVVCLSFSVDDSFLQKAAASIPKHSIFLIEDIDCAFSPCIGDGDALYPPMNHFTSRFVPGMYPSPMGHVRGKSLVTLSGLLNVLDGVGSEGKLFFATVGMAVSRTFFFFCI